MSFFSKVSDLFYDLFDTEPEEEAYIDSAGEDGQEAGPRMAGALPARAVRVCFRELASKGELPGVRKASW